MLGLARVVGIMVIAHNAQLEFGRPVFDFLNIEARSEVIASKLRHLGVF